jgi:predicted GH43/DUF377 family glycosyl hydrolase
LELDEMGNTKKMKQLELPHQTDKKLPNDGIEDVRFFILKKKIYGIGNAYKANLRRRMCLIQLEKKELVFLDIPSEADSSDIQKNWSPFVYKNRLMCEYNIEPHHVLEIDEKTGEIMNDWKTGISSQIVKKRELHGGTPSILIGDKYLGLAHTCITYNHFFYLFEKDPPFRIIAKSKYFRFDGKERVQFATGLSLYDNKIHVSYGVNDHTNRISIYDLDDVIARCNPL